MITLETAITALSNVGAARAALLEKIGIVTVGDLLNYGPRRYLDLTNPQPISSWRLGDLAVLNGEVRSVTARRSRQGKVIVTALLADDTGLLPAVWFNQPYRKGMLRVGQKMIFAGAVGREWKTGGLSLASPLTETKPRVVPLYSLTRGVTSRLLSSLAAQALTLVEVADHLSDEARQQADVVDLMTAYRYLHQPVSMDQVRAGHRRLAFDQLYSLQVELAKIRASRAAQPTVKIEADVSLLKDFVRQLPFKLTDDQRRSIWEMAQEMGVSSNPMYRLLNGDVGSGKTVVAAALALLTVKAGWRVIMMAPTEILATQHESTLAKLLAPFGIDVGLVTARVKNDQSAVLVGTHAVLGAIDRQKVGLVIVDEQHRFGVEQREQLVEQSKHDNQLVPHFLSLTATPIPRSLALALFGDLSLSFLRQLPAGRQPIATTVLAGNQVADAYAAIRAAAARGEQAYVVCPLIEEPSGDGLVLDERRGVTTVWQTLSRDIFPDLKVGMLHGRLKPKEKEQVIAQFNQGEINILVSTSVVEVGVDVPNATVMLIESADRFGVAQLHQLRGRVGRSDKPSTCWLILRSDEESAKQRCERVASTMDGFALAQFDLTQRGPGDLIGLTQKGINPIFLKDLDVTLLQQAHELARKSVC